MATLPVNDRLTGPFIAAPGQTDFPSDFPLLVLPGTDAEDGVVLSKTVAGVTVEIDGTGFDIVNVTANAFTVRTSVPMAGGETVFIVGRLISARNRALAPGGAVRTEVLEADAAEQVARQQEMARDLALAFKVQPGQVPPSADDLAALPGAAAALAAIPGQIAGKLDVELEPVTDAGPSFTTALIVEKPLIPERFNASAAMMQGTADITDVFQAMADATQQDDRGKRKVVEPGNGVFRMDGQVVTTIGNYDGSVFAMRGAKNNGTKFVADDGNADGLFKIIRPFNMEHVHISDIALVSRLQQRSSLYPAATLNVNNGVGLWITTDLVPGTGGYGVQDDTAVRIERVHTHGDGPNSGVAHYVGKWGRAAIQVDYAWFPYIADCHFRGVFEKGTPEEGTVNNLYALLMNHCYAPEVSALKVNGYWRTAISNSGKEVGPDLESKFQTRWEGGRYRHCIIGGLVADAFEMTHAYGPGSLQSPGFQILDNHINARRFGVIANGHRQIQITGNEFYAQSDAAPFGEALPAACIFNDCGDIDTTNNLIGEPGRYTNDDDAYCGYRLGGEIAGFKSMGDRFNFGGIGVRVGAAQVSRSVQVINAITSGKRIDGLWAPFKRFVDKSTSSAISWTETVQGFEDTHLTISTSQDTTASPVEKNFRDRKDFATVVDPKLGERRFSGRDSAGVETAAAVMEASFVQNTAGEVTGSLRFVLPDGGDLSNAMVMRGGAAIFGDIHFGTVVFGATTPVGTVTVKDTLGNLVKIMVSS